VERGIRRLIPLLLVTAQNRLVDANSDQQDEADGADPKHLEGVPDKQDHEDVEPSRPASVEDSGADSCGVEVGRGQEHRGGAPLEAAAGTDRVEQDVGGRVPA